MARVGQTTPSGGREWGLHPGLSGCRLVTVPAGGGTLNHIGGWLREQTAINANDLVAGLYTEAGALLYQSAVLENDIDSTVTFAEYQIPFAGQSVAAGNYVLLVIASEDNGLVVLQGQNDSAGLPTFALMDPVITFPTLPASVVFDTSATRQWDIYLDYTPGSAAATLSAGTPSGTIGTQTTATVGATTNQSTGNFYVVVDSGANLSGVTASQIKAGQRASGAAALAAGDVAVSTTSPSVGVSGLVANTAYAYAAIQNNANGDSNIVTGTFTTASATAVSGGSGGVRARVATLMMT